MNTSALELLLMARCPNTDCIDGGYYGPHGEAIQRQWCAERTAALSHAAGQEAVHSAKDAGIELSSRETFVPCDCGCGRSCCAHCGADVGFLTPEQPPASAEVGRDADEARQWAWNEFESEFLTDGNGHAPANTYAVCGESFDRAWTNGPKAAYEAAKASYFALHPKATKSDAERRWAFVRGAGKLPVRCSAGYYYEDGIIYPSPEAAIDAAMAASSGRQGDRDDK